MPEMTPDFRNRTPAIDPMAIANVLQRKAQIEEQRRQYEQDRKDKQIAGLMDAVLTGQKIASNMMTMAENRTKLQREKNEDAALQKAQDVIQEPSMPQNLPEASLNPQENQQVIQDYQQDQKKRLLSAMMGADKKDVIDNLTKAQLASPNDPKSRYQQTNISFKDKNGVLRTVKASFDTGTGTTINPMTGQPITKDTDLSTLPDAGYAQENSVVGYDPSGKPVIKNRLGDISVEGEKYDGPIYEKLQNAPAAMASVKGDLLTLRQQLSDVKAKFQTTFVGPLASRAKTIAQYRDELSDADQVEFQQQLFAYRNSMIKAITGAQMSEPEAERLLKQLPDDKKSPVTFMKQLDIAQKNTERTILNKMRSLAQAGYVFDRESVIDADTATQLVDKQMKDLLPKESSSEVPTVGGMFNGKKVLKVKRIK